MQGNNFEKLYQLLRKSSILETIDDEELFFTLLINGISRQGIEVYKAAEDSLPTSSTAQ